MQLFDVLPDRFFNVLTGKNKIIYAEVLLNLFEQYRASRFGIEYELMQDICEEILETRAEMGMSFEPDDESLIPNETEGNVYRIQANAILRRLQDTKWIDVETRESWARYIILPQYAGRLLATFSNLCEDRAVEYQRFAFMTYGLLTGEEAKIRPSMAIYEAHQVTQQFVDELTMLANNIKHHSEQLKNMNSIQDVLDHHFDEYRKAVVDKSYHRLKTSDHVSRYRQEILDTLQKWILDDNWFEHIIDDALRNEPSPHMSREAVGDSLRKAINDIMDLYRGLDDIFFEIDKRHNRYISASYNRARYFAQHGVGLDATITEILEQIGKNEIPEHMLSEIFSLQRVHQISEKSLYTPKKPPIPFKPAPHVVVPIPEELKRELKNKQLINLQNTITMDKTCEYVFFRMGDKNEISIEELAPTNFEEFLYLAHVYLYGYQKRSPFTLIRSKDDRILRIGPYFFVDHRIQRVSQKGGIQRV